MEDSVFPVIPFTTPKPRPAKKGKKKSRKRDTYSVFEAQKKFPGICTGCWGDGAVLLDSSTAKRLDIVLCPGCLAKGKCSKCRKHLPKGWQENIDEFLEPPVKCRKCGWEDGDLPVITEENDE